VVNWVHSETEIIEQNKTSLTEKTFLLEIVMFAILNQFIIF